MDNQQRAIKKNYYKKQLMNKTLMKTTYDCVVIFRKKTHKNNNNQTLHVVRLFITEIKSIIYIHESLTVCLFVKNF
jgi:hypothetical protein